VSSPEPSPATVRAPQSALSRARVRASSALASGVKAWLAAGLGLLLLCALGAPSGSADVDVRGGSLQAASAAPAHPGECLSVASSARAGFECRISEAEDDPSEGFAPAPGPPRVAARVAARSAVVDARDAAGSFTVECGSSRGPPGSV
jgi:hypothetical protein